MLLELELPRLLAPDYCVEVRLQQNIASGKGGVLTKPKTHVLPSDSQQAEFAVTPTAWRYDSAKHSGKGGVLAKPKTHVPFIVSLTCASDLCRALCKSTQHEILTIVYSTFHIHISPLSISNSVDAFVLTHKDSACVVRQAPQLTLL